MGDILAFTIFIFWLYAMGHPTVRIMPFILNKQRLIAVFVWIV